VQRVLLTDAEVEIEIAAHAKAIRHETNHAGKQ